MENRNCPKCGMLPELPEMPVTIYLFTEIDFLAQKLLDKLRKAKINLQVEETLFTVPNRNFTELVNLLTDLSEVEQEGIKVCYSSGELSISSLISCLKPLKYFVSTLTHSEYLSMLKDNRFKVYFHPIVNFKEREVFGFECLIRGVNENGEIVSPAFLFEAARQTDTLFYLDRTCRENAIKAARTKITKGFNIFVNFLPTVIYDPVFCLQTTVKLANQLNMDPQNLIFEIVETEKVKDIKHLKRILDFYMQHGFRVALDDIGTGYSSLDVFIKLYPNFIKIGRDLIEDLDRKSLKRDVVRAMVDVAEKNGIEVIAEGVERKEEAETLSEIGVNIMQGFLFAKPGPEPIYEINF
ncbi:MAG: EAL domain-containing protein [Thermodesulforhabdaceae bacterium]